ncbi:MAG: sulfatase [Halanaerobiales bacterium]|nr:sulfatase [Halanaerobiales bacterium]
MKPNILYIHSHDTGRYIEPYGHLIPTPNLKKLAKEGVLFRKAFSAAPTCSPSRASLLTGQYPHNNKQFGLVNRGFELPDTSKHIVNVLKNKGYLSTLIGMQHIRSNPNSIGYDNVLDVKNNNSENVTPKACKFIEKSIEEPFFLSIGFEETHRPFHELEDDTTINYTNPPTPIPDTYQTRKDMAEYKQSAKILDQGIGKIFKTLKENDLYNNTIIIFTTDHGIPFPNMKCNLSDHGIGVSLIIRGPYGFEKGKVIDSMVSQIDIFPTLCEIIGIKKPDWLQGQSFLSLIKGDKESINEEIFAEVNYHTAYEPMRAVRTNKWKYIRRYRNRTKPFLSNTDESYSKDVLLENDWADTYIYKEELYNLMLDPNEADNLAYDKTKAEILEEMRNRLDRWMKETDDPLENGPVPRPESALVSKDEDETADDIWNYIDKPEGRH